MAGDDTIPEGLTEMEWLEREQEKEMIELAMERSLNDVNASQHHPAPINTSHQPLHRPLQQPQQHHPPPQQQHRHPASYHHSFSSPGGNMIRQGSDRRLSASYQHQSPYSYGHPQDMRHQDYQHHHHHHRNYYHTPNRGNNRDYSRVSPHHYQGSYEGNSRGMPPGNYPSPHYNNGNYRSQQHRPYNDSYEYQRSPSYRGYEEYPERTMGSPHQQQAYDPRTGTYYTDHRRRSSPSGPSPSRLHYDDMRSGLPEVPLAYDRPPAPNNNCDPSRRRRGSAPVESDPRSHHQQQLHRRRSSPPPLRGDVMQQELPRPDSSQARAAVLQTARQHLSEEEAILVEQALKLAGKTNTLQGGSSGNGPRSNSSGHQSSRTPISETQHSRGSSSHRSSQRDGRRYRERVQNPPQNTDAPPLNPQTTMDLLNRASASKYLSPEELNDIEQALIDNDSIRPSPRQSRSSHSRSSYDSRQQYQQHTSHYHGQSSQPVGHSERYRQSTSDGVRYEDRQVSRPDSNSDPSIPRDHPSRRPHGADIHGGPPRRTPSGDSMTLAKEEIQRAVQDNRLSREEYDQLMMALDNSSGSRENEYGDISARNERDMNDGDRSRKSSDNGHQSDNDRQYEQSPPRQGNRPEQQLPPTSRRHSDAGPASDKGFNKGEEQDQRQLLRYAHGGRQVLNQQASASTGYTSSSNNDGIYSFANDENNYQPQPRHDNPQGKARALDSSSQPPQSNDNTHMDFQGSNDDMRLETSNNRRHQTHLSRIVRGSSSRLRRSVSFDSVPSNLLRERMSARTLDERSTASLRSYHSDQSSDIRLLRPNDMVSGFLKEEDPDLDRRRCRSDPLPPIPLATHDGSKHASQHEAIKEEDGKAQHDIEWIPSPGDVEFAEDMDVDGAHAHSDNDWRVEDRESGKPMSDDSRNRARRGLVSTAYRSQPFSQSSESKSDGDGASAVTPPEFRSFCDQQGVVGDSNEDMDCSAHIGGSEPDSVIMEDALAVTNTAGRDIVHIPAAAETFLERNGASHLSQTSREFGGIVSGDHRSEETIESSRRSNKTEHLAAVSFNAQKPPIEDSRSSRDQPATTGTLVADSSDSPLLPVATPIQDALAEHARGEPIEVIGEKVDSLTAGASSSRGDERVVRKTTSSQDTGRDRVLPKQDIEIQFPGSSNINFDERDSANRQEGYHLQSANQHSHDEIIFQPQLTMEKAQYIAPEMGSGQDPSRGQSRNEREGTFMQGRYNTKRDESRRARKNDEMKVPQDVQVGTGNPRGTLVRQSSVSSLGESTQYSLILAQPNGSFRHEEPGRAFHDSQNWRQSENARLPPMIKEAIESNTSTSQHTPPNRAQARLAGLHSDFEGEDDQHVAPSAEHDRFDEDLKRALFESIQMHRKAEISEDDIIDEKPEELSKPRLTQEQMDHINRALAPSSPADNGCFDEAIDGLYPLEENGLAGMQNETDLSQIQPIDDSPLGRAESDIPLFFDSPAQALEFALQNAKNEEERQSILLAQQLQEEEELRAAQLAAGEDSNPRRVGAVHSSSPERMRHPLEDSFGQHSASRDGTPQIGAVRSSSPERVRHPLEESYSSMSRDRHTQVGAVRSFSPERVRHPLEDSFASLPQSTARISSTTDTSGDLNESSRRSSSRRSSFPSSPGLSLHRQSLEESLSSRHNDDSYQLSQSHEGHQRTRRSLEDSYSSSITPRGSGEDASMPASPGEDGHVTSPASMKKRSTRSLQRGSPTSARSLFREKKMLGSVARLGKKGVTSIMHTVKKTSARTFRSNQNVMAGLEEEEHAAKMTFDDLDPETRVEIDRAVDKGVISQLNSVVKYGSEATIFHADKITDDGDEIEIAVKVYKRTEGRKARDLSELSQFQNISSEHHLALWTGKEYRNLKRAMKAGVPSPAPIFAKNNVLFMRFMGTEAQPAPQLGELDLRRGHKRWKPLYKQIVEALRRLYLGAMLVHGSLDESNILVAPRFLIDPSVEMGSKEYTADQAVLIDFGQTVDSKHPDAIELLRADLQRLRQFFVKQGIRTPSVDDALKFVTSGSASTSAEFAKAADNANTKGV